MEKIVFTNGCFDLIHPGHINLLRRARALGTRLIVGINSDRSVRSIKGKGRPVMSEDARRQVLLGIRYVDEVHIFDEPTPESLIRELKPDVLVKGGDWKTSEIIGGDFVLANGGEVLSLPLLDNFSSSKIVEAARRDGSVASEGKFSDDSRTANSLSQHIETFQRIISGEIDSIDACATLIFETFKSGNKVLLCGNGGSAADAQHIAAEFVGRYETERQALPAIALTTDTSALTALANDYDFERVFARQVDALAVSGDLLIAISTSGNSPNVLAAVMAARGKGCKVIGMSGAGGKKLAGLCDLCVMVPSDRTARIQEAHITIGHLWCDTVDGLLKESQI